MESLQLVLALIIAYTLKVFINRLINGMIESIWEGFVKLFQQALGYEVATALGNIIAGIILGYLSLLIIPKHITPNLEIRFVNLIVTPFIFGALLNLSANIKFYRKLLVFDLINFISGYTFALAWAGVRFIFAK